MDADLSEHFGRTGEFLIGVIGLLLLALMHKDIRRAAGERLGKLGRGVTCLHGLLERKLPLYRRWADAFRFLFRERRDLFLIVLALTAFDYLAGWHAEFMYQHFALFPELSSYDRINELKAVYFSAPAIFGLLRIIGYALFCWLAYQAATGASYKDAARFSPLRRLAGLFLCLAGTEIIANRLAPDAVLHPGDAFSEFSLPLVTAAAFIYGALFCLIGARLFNIRLNGRILSSTFYALAGYLLLTQLLQWLFYLTDFAAFSPWPWLRTLNYHVSDFTYTLLWNVALVGFAVTLANRSAADARNAGKSEHEQSDRSANAV